MIITYIFKNIKPILIGLVVLMSIALTYYVNRSKVLKADRDRQAENVVNITKDNAVLNLTVDEFRKIDTADKRKIDSLTSANKIKDRALSQALVMNTIYKDTNKVSANTGTPVLQPQIANMQPLKPVYKIPVHFDSPCWLMKGEILTTDPSAKFDILERRSSNSAQLIVTKERRFLFWITKKAQYKAYSDCGPVTFTLINFVKK